MFCYIPLTLSSQFTSTPLSYIGHLPICVSVLKFFYRNRSLTFTKIYTSIPLCVNYFFFWVSRKIFSGKKLWKWETCVKQRKPILFKSHFRILEHQFLLINLVEWEFRQVVSVLSKSKIEKYIFGYMHWLLI